MSKVIITVDTKANTVVCNIDGEVVSGLKSVSVDSFIDFDNEPQVHLFLSLEGDKLGKDGDLRSRTHVSTSEDLLAQNAVKEGKGSFSDDKTLIVYEKSIVNLGGLLGRKNQEN